MLVFGGKMYGLEVLSSTSGSLKKIRLFVLVVVAMFFFFKETGFDTTPEVFNCK